MYQSHETKPRNKIEAGGQDQKRGEIIHPQHYTHMFVLNLFITFISHSVAAHPGCPNLLTFERGWCSVF